MRCLNAHGSQAAVDAVVESIALGQRVAYVTDAGTPSVSDPGRALCSAAIARGLPVSALPGPSAVTAAVALSALVEGAFSFLGFLPRKGPLRAESLGRIAESFEPCVFFESPKRLGATLAELSELAAERRVCVARELTKLHEECLYGTVGELAARQEPWRGEIVVVVAPRPAAERRPQEVPPAVAAALDVAVQAGASPSRLARALADATGVPRNLLYARALEVSEATEATPRGSGDGAPPEG